MARSLALKGYGGGVIPRRITAVLIFIGQCSHATNLSCGMSGNRISNHQLGAFIQGIQPLKGLLRGGLWGVINSKASLLIGRACDALFGSTAILTANGTLHVER